MSIKDLYKEVEKNKENEIKNKKYSMSIDDFIKEHKCLIKTLREGSREELLLEAEKQEKELKKCLKECDIKIEDDEDDK